MPRFNEIIELNNKNNKLANIPVEREEVWKNVVNDAVKAYNDHHPTTPIPEHFARYNTVMDDWFGNRKIIDYGWKGDTYCLDHDYLEGFNQLAWDMTNYYYDNYVM